MQESRSDGPTAWVDPDDAPELTAEWFEKAGIRDGERVVRRGRPPLPNPKRQLSVRLDPDLIERMRALGPGWQTQMNEALRRWLDQAKQEFPLNKARAI